MHFKCCNPKCTELIRADRWDTHVLTMTSDRHLQEDPGDVLERSMNFAADRAGLQKRCTARGSRTQLRRWRIAPSSHRPPPPAEDEQWDTKEVRAQRIVTFMEQRHYLTLARLAPGRLPYNLSLSPPRPPSRIQFP